MIGYRHVTVLHHSLSSWWCSPSAQHSRLRAHRWSRMASWLSRPSAPLTLTSC
jgi:hypothetical protein